VHAQPADGRLDVPSRFHVSTAEVLFTGASLCERTDGRDETRQIVALTSQAL